MYIKRHLGTRKLIKITWHYILGVALWAGAITLLYHFGELSWLSIPWLPISLIGTAVAFYIGFKNNSAYDRMWEARKIWGGIVNSSRAWGSMVKSFVGNQFAEQKASERELNTIKRKLIYRHIGWLYALRSQLLIISPWEHANQEGRVGKKGRKYRKQFGVGLVDDEVTKIELRHFLPPNEYERLINHTNTATQIIDQQSQHLAELRESGLIEDFRHMELQKVLNDFYIYQGKCERIKKFPLPRQYANASFTFVGLFILLLPFGIVSEFAKLGEWGIWLSIPFTVLVAWIYIIMEMIGDYSENPFQGMANDIPMLSLCRTIEIDLKEMLGEEELPEAIQAKNGILM